MEKHFQEHIYLPPLTKDVLGGHLHQKVSEVLSDNLIDGKTSVYSGCSLADKVTGILLERSLKDIHNILQDDRLLLENIRLVLLVLHKEYPHLPETLAADNLRKRQILSREEVGEVLFERICNIEESMAPQITGMLLELDLQKLCTLLNEDSLLDAAVRKSKKALTSAQSSLSSARVESDERRNWKSQVLDHEAEKEYVGQQLYDKILKVHPECASHLTGMILELNLPDLKLLLRNTEQLQTAINRAYKEWLKSF
uniref:PABC domain-containing protein n=1 Tax=Arion vulgaris TaxID=1028688 RepID=A0A0B6Y7J9_9EUPU